ncbi:alpha-D-ribose 1-methylphosphonate 5-triphosphate diphosphatase [Shimia ponticola]|uniref:alpha-D-ribose 1-methylphosphonate 5-triphosphate diphosphatase n=1 Tax=Shimia ponticola TaxID=2582893 RepID=UPI0011BF655D|nr:alpha-D-ribose 1-methylphosphonate 5-triphosphate diphosphatase [Shimia ponticola]
MPRDSVFPAGIEGFLSQFDGFQVRPGIVDLHGDGFERHLAPRRGALKDLRQGFYALDAELAASGVTTAYLAQFWSWEGGMRGPDFAKRMIATLADIRDELRTDMRIQLRVEISLIDQFDDILNLVESAGIGYVVLNDHLPHNALAKGKRPPRLTGQALKSGRSPEAHLALLQDLHARQASVPDAVKQFVSDLRARRVRVGSHDDASATARAWYADAGADIAEFPVTSEAVDAARDGNAPVILGAPNIVRGGSHGGGLVARDHVIRGACDVLVSDYHYPALANAALALDADMPSGRAWDLISAKPAAVMGLADRGVIAPGYRADIVVMTPDNRIVGTMVAGRWSFIAGELADHLGV